MSQRHCSAHWHEWVGKNAGGDHGRSRGGDLDRSLGGDLHVDHGAGLALGPEPDPELGPHKRDSDCHIADRSPCSR